MKSRCQRAIVFHFMTLFVTAHSRSGRAPTEVPAKGPADSMAIISALNIGTHLNLSATRATLNAPIFG